MHYISFFFSSGIQVWIKKIRISKIDILRPFLVSVNKLVYQIQYMILVSCVKMIIDSFSIYFKDLERMSKALKKIL